MPRMFRVIKGCLNLLPTIKSCVYSSNFSSSENMHPLQPRARHLVAGGATYARAVGM